jgi:hypothetical protein
MRDRHLRQPIWIVPLVIAALVAVFGWWGNARLRQTVEGQLKAELAATLDANVTALDLWTTNQAKLATSLADESGVRALALRILDKFDQAEANNHASPASPASSWVTEPSSDSVKEHVPSSRSDNRCDFGNSERKATRASADIP